MAYSFQKIPVKDLAKGLNLQAAESALELGYSERLRNVECNRQGYLAKRPGYQGYYGNLPFRVRTLDYEDDTITFTLDGSVDTTNFIKSPLVVYGLLGNPDNDVGGGDFSLTAIGQYYNTFSARVPDTLQAKPPATPASLIMPESRHNQPTDDLFVTLLKSTDTTDNDSTWILPDEVRVPDITPFDVEIDVNETMDAFVLITGKEAVGGASYTQQDTIGEVGGIPHTDVNAGTDTFTKTAHLYANDDRVVFASGTLPGGISAATTYYVVNRTANTFQLSATSGGSVLDITSTPVGTYVITNVTRTVLITAATHALSNFNIIPQFWRQLTPGSTWYQTIPSLVTSADGDYSIVFTNSNTSNSMTLKTILAAAPLANISSPATIPPGSGTIVVSGVTNDYFHFAVYEEAGDDRILIMPGSVVRDDAADTITFTILNGSASTKTYVAMYESATLNANVITVQANTAIVGSYTDSEPQVTIWGLDHAVAYDDTTKQGGHVVHLDTYRRELEERSVSGLGGNLYTARTIAEAGDAYLIPEFEINIEGRADTTRTIAPAFAATTETYTRSSTQVRATNTINGDFQVSAVAYVSSGVATYTLALTGKTGTFAAAVALSPADYLTVRDLAHDINNGRFKITAVNDVLNTITVENPALTLAAFDESGACGTCNVYMDRFALQDASEFLAEDTVESAAFGDDTLTVHQSSGTSTIILKSVTTDYTIPSGTAIYGLRTTNFLPVVDTDNIVLGDMCAVSGLARQVRVKAIAAYANKSVTNLVVSSGVVTFTSTAHGLRVGDTVLVLRTGFVALEGAFIVATTPTANTFTAATTSANLASTAVTAIIRGGCILIDESLNLEDSGAAPTTFTVVGRWIPAEIPVTADELPKKTAVFHFDAAEYDEQDIMRSTMSASNMYLANYADEIYKYDGTHLYRAGLPRWQPQLFSNIDTSTPSIVENPKMRYTARDAAGSTFTMETLGDLQVGDRLVDDVTNALYTIQSIDVVNTRVVVVPDVAGSLVSTAHSFTSADIDIGDLAVQIDNDFQNGDLVTLSTDGELPTIDTDFKNQNIKIDYLLFQATNSSPDDFITITGSIAALPTDLVTGDVVWMYQAATPSYVSDITLLPNVPYYIIRLDPTETNYNTRAFLATSQANALAGTKITTLTTAGATSTAFALLRFTSNLVFDDLRTNFSTTIGTDTLTTAASHGMTTGDEFYFYYSTSAAFGDFKQFIAPTPGLSMSVPYYAISTGATTIRVATSRQNALDNVFLDLTDSAGIGSILRTAPHNIRTNDSLSFSTDTLLPIGLTADDVYIAEKISDNAFRLANLTTRRRTLSDTPVHTVTIPAIHAGRQYYIVGAASSEFQLSETLGGDPISFDAVGSGNHTVSLVTSTANTIRRLKRFQYYFRLNAIDANQNIIISAATGKDDFIVELVDAGEVNMRLVGLPTFGHLDYDALELEVYRREVGSADVYRRIAIKDLDFNIGDGYVDISDGANTEVLVDIDSTMTALAGAEVMEHITQAPRAKYMTSLSNRLVLGNLKDYPEFDIVLRSDSAGSFSVPSLVGKTLTFKKDVLTPGVTTDMDSIITLEFRNTSFLPSSLDFTTNATQVRITRVAHGLAVNDWVYFFHADVTTNKRLRLSGWFQVSAVISANQFAVELDHDNTIAATAADVSHYCQATNPKNVPVYIDTDGNYGQYQLATAADMDEFSVMLRAANALNAVNRQCVQDGFQPWLNAAAGSEIGLGRLVVRQEQVEDTDPVLVVPTPPTGATWFVNNIRRSNETVSAQSKLFPSRLVISQQNFSEIFNRPYDTIPQVTTVVDINAADGQEITGVVPFFGESVFGNGQLESTAVVFKTNSIYLVDVSNGQISKLQTRGMGCTAPYTIAHSHNGIIFANETGIYRLNRDQSISHVGENVERYWQDDINKDQLAKATATHYSGGNQYKLSIPVDDDLTNSRVLVYDHQREGRAQEYGAWSEFDNHPAIAWANLSNDAVFAATTGRVFSIRRANDETDYRDDDQAITMDIILGATDFGQSGSRKIVGNVVSHFQLRRSGMTGTQIQVSVDLDGVFESAGTFVIARDGIAKMAEELASMPNRRLTYIQLRYINAVKDEGVVLTGVDYSVALMSDKGVKEIHE